VDVVFDLDRRVELDHVRELVDVEAARGHFGGHHDLDVARAQIGHRAVALVLARLALQGARVVPGGVQLGGQTLDGVLGIGEDE
jgi:hypothetical protein